MIATGALINLSDRLKTDEYNDLETKDLQYRSLQNEMLQFVLLFYYLIIFRCILSTGTCVSRSTDISTRCMMLMKHFFQLLIDDGRVD